jgi:hypothetical protein
VGPESHLSVAGVDFAFVLLYIGLEGSRLGGLGA